MIIQSNKVWINEGFQPAQLVVEDSKINEILSLNTKKPDVDYENFRILPGLIDIHDHGYDGLGANYGDLAYFKKWCEYLPSEGVTSFLPTTSTIPNDDHLEALSTIANVIDKSLSGAQILGIHTEGIIISLEKKGAHDPKLLLKPTIELVDSWIEASRNNIKMVALAPEYDVDHKVIKYLNSKGIIVSIAHTNADFEEANLAIDDGASNITHTFNAMTGIHHREPGVVTAALTRDDAYAELICDGRHVDFSVGKMVGKLKGKDKLIAITDSVPSKGLEPGIYRKEGTQYNIIIEEDGTSRLEDGTLSGSTSRMIDMISNLYFEMGLSLSTAINSGTINPANLLNINHCKGLLEKGYDADFIVVNDNFEVQKTYVLGEEVFSL